MFGMGKFLCALLLVASLSAWGQTETVLRQKPIANPIEEDEAAFSLGMGRGPNSQVEKGVATHWFFEGQTPSYNVGGTLVKLIAAVQALVNSGIIKPYQTDYFLKVQFGQERSPLTLNWVHVSSHQQAGFDRNGGRLKEGQAKSGASDIFALEFKRPGGMVALGYAFLDQSVSTASRALDFPGSLYNENSPNESPYAAQNGLAVYGWKRLPTGKIARVRLGTFLMWDQTDHPGDHSPLYATFAFNLEKANRAKTLTGGVTLLRNGQDASGIVYVRFSWPIKSN
jgi:hypothetical protein